MPWTELVDFWQRYHTVLARLVSRIPEAALGRTSVVGDDQPMTLRALIEDYVRHMQHHLDHILRDGGRGQAAGT